MKGNIPFATAQAQYQAYGTDNYTWYYSDGGSETQITPNSSTNPQGGGYLVGICTGNSGLVYSDGSVETSSLTKTMSMSNFSFSAQTSKQFDNI